MKYYTLFTLAFITILTGCKSIFQNKNPLDYTVELKFLSRIDTSKSDARTVVYSTRYFLLKNNSWKNLKDSAFIQYLDTMKREGLTQASYAFYKESTITNEINLMKNPRDLDRYSQSDDLLLVYEWFSNQRKWLIYRYTDGKMVSAGGEIKITDIK